MKLAVLSDIHSNFHAFRTCVDWMDDNAVNGVLFAGDYVTDCPYPEKTMALIRDVRKRYPAWFVRGNREDTVIQGADGNIAWKYPQESIRYTVEHLNSCDIDFFRVMPSSQIIEIDGFPTISMTHGDFHNKRSMVYPDNEEIRRLLDEMPGAVHICGHTHRPFIYPGEDKLVLNPGSVGVPVNGTPKAEMAVLEYTGQRWNAKLLQLPYDVESEIRDFKESGLEQCAGVWARCVKAELQTGRNYSLECVEKVSQYSKTTGLAFESREIWERVADELGI